MPEQSELYRRAEQAAALAREAGAGEAWASASRRRSVELEYRDGRIEKVEESTSRGLSIELYVDGRFSSHRTTDLRPETLQRFIPEAVALTRALEEDPFRQITPAALFENRPTMDLGMVDAQVASVSAEQRLRWCEEIFQNARDHEKAISATVGVSTTESTYASVSTHGFAAEESYTSIWAGGEVTLRDEGDRRPEGWFWAGGRGVSAVPSREEIGRRTLADAARRLGSSQGQTQRTTMIVENRAAGRLLGRLLGAANARAFSQQRSFFAGKIGERVVSDKLTLTDDPLIVGGLGSRHFDGEGISARSFPVIEAGVLRNIYVDTYYGRKVEMAPTTGSPSNLIVAPGDKDLAGLMQDAGNAVLVTGWLGGNADSTTGDFSFGIRGHLVENGQIGAPVAEMNVTGNLLDLFSRLSAVGNDPWMYSRSRTPTLVFDGVQFSGAEAPAASGK